MVRAPDSPCDGLPVPSCGVRRLELSVAEPELSVDFFAGVLGWTVIAEPGGSFSGFVGDRLAARVVAGDAGWHVVFGDAGARGLRLNSSVGSGRVLHGPWAPPPRHGEPCWVELVSAEFGFWERELGWSVSDRVFSVSRQGESRVVAGSSSVGALADGWGVFFAVDDVGAACARVSELDGEVVSSPSSVSSLGVVAAISGPKGGSCWLLERPAGWGGAQGV
ncbi:VOC family protein [Lentzea sp. NPDC060358]|uniref:VOC family protein n=1 Tax=Lentzea sp. NPDC060358 TaxID=3347103 RepID=UPI003649F1F8